MDLKYLNSTADLEIQKLRWTKFIRYFVSIISHWLLQRRANFLLSEVFLCLLAWVWTADDTSPLPDLCFCRNQILLFGPKKIYFDFKILTRHSGQLWGFFIPNVCKFISCPNPHFKLTEESKLASGHFLRNFYFLGNNFQPSSSKLMIWKSWMCFITVRNVVAAR